MRISGRVVKGDGYGKILGFPTANLDRRQWSRLKTKPRLGVWAGTAVIKNSCLEGRQEKLSASQQIKNYPAGVIIGPVEKTGLPKIEAHLIGFKGNLYGQKVELVLAKFLRAYKKFASVTLLKRQITKDLKQAKQHGN